MEYTFASALVLLILIMDPFGNFPLFASILKQYDLEERNKIILREHVFAFFILIAFLFTGQSLLNLMGLSRASLEIAGGVILFLIAIKMVFPEKTQEESFEHKPMIVPLAIPAIAGPSAMATVMLMANSQPTQMPALSLVILTAIVISATILIVLNKAQKFLGKNFIVAMEKLMGLVLVALSVEMLIKGIKSVL